MKYQDSLKKINEIALYYSIVDEKIYIDNKFLGLIELINNEKNINYALYTDNFLLKNNLFIPNFHTIYLGVGYHKVILDRTEDLWLLDTFKNNQYYFLLCEGAIEPDIKEKEIIKINKVEEVINNDIS
jgi:hypothetical protein